MKLFRRRLWSDEKRLGPLLMRNEPFQLDFVGRGEIADLIPVIDRQNKGLREDAFERELYYAGVPFVFGRMPPSARSTEIKLALTLMGSVATGMDWPWP